MYLNYIHTESVIAEVRQRPILWDPTHVLNKDRDARTLSWIEVYEALSPDYNEMDDAKKSKFGKLIQQRWKTARDAYMRTKKFEKQGIYKKHYVFCEELRFLDKIEQGNQAEADSSGTVTPSFVECVYEDSTQSAPDVEIKLEPEEPESFTPAVQDTHERESRVQEFGSQPEGQRLLQEPFSLQPLIQESFQLESEIQEPIGEATASNSKKPRILRKRKLSSSNDNFQKEIMGMVKENSKLLKNDDLAFCMSLLPITKDFSVQQKLTFRMEILKIALEVSNISNRQETNSDSEHSSGE